VEEIGMSRSARPSESKNLVRSARHRDFDAFVKAVKSGRLAAQTGV
jgi:hypothetical protein